MKNLFDEEIQNNDVILYLKSISCGGGSVKEATIAKIENDKLVTWSINYGYSPKDKKIVFKRKSLENVDPYSIIKKVKVTEAKKFIKNHLAKVDYIRKEELTKLSKDVFEGLNLK